MLARFAKKAQVFIGDGQLEMTGVTFGCQCDDLLKTPTGFGIVALREPVFSDGLRGRSILRIEVQRRSPFAQGVLRLFEPEVALAQMKPCQRVLWIRLQN